MNVWFLTIVYSGHVNMTSIIVNEDTPNARVQAYEEFRNSYPSYYVMENDLVFKSDDIVIWESQWIKASLIKA